MTVYPLSVVRTLALVTQGLVNANDQTNKPGLEAQSAMVEQVAAVQIDTLQMVQRSHFLVMWSRLGNYAVEDFEKLAYDPEHRRLFEGWMHAASILPLRDYRFQIPHQQQAKNEGSSWYGNWIKQPGNRELLDEVRLRLHQEGGLRSQDFEYAGPKRGAWWDWKPAKIALEHLHTYGEVMIASRVNFQRVYDLTERVLPDWVDLTVPTIEERNRYWTELGAYALGICRVDQAGDYSQRKKTSLRPVLRDLLKDEVLLPIQARLADGEIHELVVHRDNLPLLERVADGEIKAERTTFLSPFDSLFWARQRDQQFWNFRQVLEAYKPSAQREWGYFCLPILHKERLIGRFDPKLDRKHGVLHLKKLYLEPTETISPELIAGVACAFTNFLEFHNAHELLIEHSLPSEFGDALLAALPLNSL